MNQKPIPTLAKQRAVGIKSDEAVIALCEKKLEDFLRGYLAQLPNVSVMPAIKFVYK